jgi:serpin B
MQIKITPILLLIAGCLLALSGCERYVYAASEKPRDMMPDVSDQETGQLTTGNTEFAIALYKKLATGSENVSFSPYSVSLGMAMAYAGARGETEKQIADTFHFALPQDRLHKAINAVDLVVTGADYGFQPGFELSIVSSLWGQKGLSLLPEFLDTLAINYGSGVRLADFMNKPDESGELVNNWVGKETRGKITDLVAPGTIGTNTGLILANAIYFKAEWDRKFPEEDTKDGDFHLIDGSMVRAPLMEQTSVFGYAEGDGWQAASMPYRYDFEDRQKSMIIILPEQARFDEIQGSLDEPTLSAIISAFAGRTVHMILPRFRSESSTEITNVLKDMGMTDPFSEHRADFSGMARVNPPYLGRVLHKVYVDVDEKGSEAAASTVITMPSPAPPPMPPPESVTYEFIADHPFIFLIRDNPTGAFLFMGRVMNPKS